MKNTHKNKFNMILAVLGVLETHRGEWEGLAGMADAVGRLRGLADGIGRVGGIQGVAQAGVAEGKNRLQVEMIERTVEIAGDLHSFAVAGRNDSLRAQSDVELSDLQNLADSLVAGRCREIHRLGVENAAGLAAFGTDAAELAALDAAILAYEPVATAPRQAIVRGKGVTESLEADVRAADRLLKDELDKSMRKFRRRNPAFAQAYEDARTIVDLGGGKAKEAPASTDDEPDATESEASGQPLGEAA